MFASISHYQIYDIIVDMRRCLVIPGTFIPYNDTVTQLVYKQLRLLDLEYDVISLSAEEDPELIQLLQKDPNGQKFHIRNTDYYNNVLFSIHNVFLPKALHHMHRYIQDAVSSYDRHEVVYTSSWPCYTIRAGKQIKEQHTDVLWIASFCDPINHSPYKYDKATYRSYSLPEKIAFHLYCHYYVVDQDEADAFEHADRLVFICPEQRDFMLDQYEKYFHRMKRNELLKKCIIVPLNYIPEWNQIQPSGKHLQHDVYTLSHFGRVYGLRLIEEFIYAVKEFHEKHPDIRFCIEQYGEFRKSDEALIRKCGLNSIFSVHSKIPYKECIEKMNESDAVLLFDTILPETEFQPYLPSKILEYSLLEKDTLGISTSRSPAYRIMKESNAIVCRYDQKEIEKGLEELIIEHHPSVIRYATDNRTAVQPLIKSIDSWFSDHH